MPARTAAEAYELAHEAKRDIESHEDRCADRYEAIRETIKEIKDWVKAAVFGLVGIGVTLGGAMAHEIYNNLQKTPPPAQVQAR